MMSAIADAYFMTIRHLRNLVRQPAWIAISLIQPIVWLLLYGALFKRIVEIPGFGGGTYIDFLTPGVVVMTALFSAGWSGMSVVDDLNRGILDRFLVTPVHRGSLIAGRILQLSVTAVIQCAIILVLGLIIGASYSGGLLGMIVLIGCAVILGSAFGSLSNAIALLARREETVIAVVNFILLPLTFLSGVFMRQNLMPGWMQHVAGYNPVNWTVQAGREALNANANWGYVFARVGYLAAFAFVSGWLATRAFRAYQRST
jgi:ABC-2 type transport system permease protein